MFLRFTIVRWPVLPNSGAAGSAGLGTAAAAAAGHIAAAAAVAAALGPVDGFGPMGPTHMQAAAAAAAIGAMGVGSGSLMGFEQHYLDHHHQPPLAFMPHPHHGPPRPPLHEFPGPAGFTSGSVPGFYYRG